ncbi:MAG: response regulator transcription factor [Lachnospiraceae bacterium]|nr:response regulator transcription factor [Lachnospiraceae bacterium]
MKEIFVVDDDVNIGNMLEELLTREGYHVTRAYSGTEALLVLSSFSPDLVLLDLMLPGLDGRELLPKLSGIPVIVVSARVGTDDKVELLLGGAADYVTKPFDTKELLARIAVQLRGGTAADAKTRLTYDDIVVDTTTHHVRVRDQDVRLTRTEYAILKLLMLNPAQVITKTLLLDRLSEETPDCMESSLRVHISNLRRKLRDSGGKDYIESVWGIGFKLK